MKRSPKRYDWQTQKRIVFATLIASMAGVALAESSHDDVCETIKVEVTGSHIFRSDAESALPIQVITLGIKNLFDRDPPFTNAPFCFQAGYDPSYADPRGPTFYEHLDFTFK